VTNAPPNPALASTWRFPKAWAWLIISCILSIVVDLGSKEVAFARVADAPVVVKREDVVRVSTEHDPRAISDPDFGIIPRHRPFVLIPGLLNFQLVLNPGAVFGMGPGQRGFFIGFTILALGFGLAMFAKWTGPRDSFAHAAIGLLVGGGLGNLYDRLSFACVRDFIHPLPGMKWPGSMKILGNEEVWPYVSNLADLFLLIGIVMLLIHLWRRDRAAEKSVDAPAPVA
jgi:signal peptidase II